MWWWRLDIKCHKCAKLGHLEKKCKSQHPQKVVNIVEDELEEELLLAISHITINQSTKGWFIDTYLWSKIFQRTQQIWYF